MRCQGCRRCRRRTAASWTASRAAGWARGASCTASRSSPWRRPATPPPPSSPPRPTCRQVDCAHDPPPGLFSAAKLTFGVRGVVCWQLHDSLSAWGERVCCVAAGTERLSAVPLSRGNVCQLDACRGAGFGGCAPGAGPVCAAGGGAAPSQRQAVRCSPTMFPAVHTPHSLGFASCQSQ